MEPISFNAILEPIDEKMVHHLIIVPDKIGEKFINGKGAPRILCSIQSNQEFPCALNPRNGRYVIIASKQLIKQNKLSINVPFLTSIRQDPHNGLGLPEELAEVLEQDEVAFKVYEAMNDGHKRGVIYYVNQAKSVDSRIKRAFDIMEKLKERGNWA